MRTCKICGAPISRNAKRGLCLKCGCRDSWIGRRQRGADNSAAECLDKIWIRFIERANFATYGVLPQCRRCAESCKQYAAKGLTRLVCKKSAEYEAIARRMEFVENVVKPGIERMMKP